MLAALPARTADPVASLAQLRFLLGEWEAVAKPGEGSGSCSFSAELQGRILVRRNHAEVPAAQGRPAGIHDDWMILYSEGPGLRADYWDNEGYAVQAAEDGAVFLSEPSAAAPRFRLIYAALPDGRVAGKFEIAPPGKPEAFSPYLAWLMQRPVKIKP